MKPLRAHLFLGIVNLVAPIVTDTSDKFYNDRAAYFNGHPEEFQQLVSITKVGE